MGYGNDLEDEHDGGEPGEDEEPSLGWTTSGVLGSLYDREQDDCDRRGQRAAAGRMLGGSGMNGPALIRARDLAGA